MGQKSFFGALSLSILFRNAFFVKITSSGGGGGEKAQMEFSGDSLPFPSFYRSQSGREGRSKGFSFRV